MNNMSMLQKQVTARLESVGISDVSDIVHELTLRGYFNAPASTTYHGSYEGGLVEHSLCVCDLLVKLTEDNNIAWQRQESPVIVGLFHDLCKMDNYIKINPIANAFEHSNDTLFKGHGSKSAIIAAQFLKLTEEELACIVYHMGAFTDSKEWSSYTGAVKEYPTVLWTHHADMLATHVEGV